MKKINIETEMNWGWILRRLLLMVAAALLLTYFLEFRYFMNDAGRALGFISEKPLVFLYSSLIMFFVVMFFTGLTRKPFLGIGLTTVAIMIITYIHISKFGLRGSPLIPEDFQFASQAGSLAKFVDIWGIVRLVLATVLVLVASWLLDRQTASFFQDAEATQGDWLRRHQIGSRLFLVIVAIVGFMVSTDFVRNHSGKRSEDIPWLNTQFLAWDQVWNYDNNGFLLGFLYNWNKYEVPRPDGYSDEVVAEINAELSAEQSEDKNPALSEKDFNIVVVLEESFYDPSIIREYYNYEGDVTPELHKIQAKYPSGQMYSLDYGGGTANMEFEVLTSLSNFWANTVPYSDVLSRVEAVPSIASYAKSQGYKTLTIHSFNGGMYKRDIVLPKEGFDEFMTELEMDFTEKDGNSSYINDRSAFNQTLKELRERDGKQMISLLTMQNHAPYNASNYDNFEFKITNIENETERTAAEVYLQTVHNSDKYLGEFIRALDEFDEPTVVLLYGDHSPGVFPRVNESSDKEIRDLSRLTPYFVYANFDLKTKDLKLPTTTPNCLTNTMFDILKVKKPAVDYLVEDVCREEPILTQGYLGGKELDMTDDLRKYEYLSYSVLGE